MNGRRYKFIISLIVGAAMVLAPLFAAGGVEAATRLRLWNFWGGSRIPLMKKQLAEFERRNPGIKVESTIPSRKRLLELLLTAVAGGSPPDVVMFDRANVPAFAEKGVLAPLDPFIKKDGLDLSIFYEGELRLGQYKGVTYELPQPTGGPENIMYYNRALFREVGLDPDRPPKTWRELEAAAKKLTIIKSGRIQRLGFSVVRKGRFHRDFKLWLSQNGGAFLSSDGRRVAFNGPKGVETLNWIVDFTDRINGGIQMVEAAFGKGGPLALEARGASFYTGKEGMYVTGPWLFFTASKNAPKLPLGFGLRPTNGTPFRNLVYRGWGYVIPKGVKNPRAAWKLLRWLTAEPGGAGKFVMAQKRPSPLKSVTEDPFYASLKHWPLVREAMSKTFSYPITPVEPFINDTLKVMVEEALYHKKSPEQAIAQAARKIQAELDRFYAKKR